MDRSDNIPGDEILLSVGEVDHVESAHAHNSHMGSTTSDFHLAGPVMASSPPPRVPAITETSITVKKMTSIELAKDRAQIASSAAMSVVHVALLKNVLDTGSENDRYYTLRLGLIIAALVLQVYGGLIALYIALLRNYYSQYKDDFLSDFSKMCCPWKCKRTNCGSGSANSNSSTGRSSHNRRHSEDCSAGCCPCHCVRNSHHDFEYRILDRYEELTEQCITADIEAANCDNELTWIKEKLAYLEKEELKCKEVEESESSNTAYLEEIKEEMRKLRKRLEEEEAKKRSTFSLKTQKQTMEEHVLDIHQQRVLKRATFWQNILNLVFYGVFVLNALITGFGLVDPAKSISAAGNQTLVN